MEVPALFSFTTILSSEAFPEQNRYKGSSLNPNPTATARDDKVRRGGQRTGGAQRGVIQAVQAGEAKVRFRCFFNVSLSVCTIHTNAFFFLVSLKFDSIHGSFCEQAMESSVVR
jgi:hypothetical protein